jgi:small-conductance mechanosensitive channel
MMTVFFYDYRGVPEGWRLGLTIVGGIAFVRLVSVFTEDSWKKWALGGLVALMAMNKFATIISLPSPLLRLYIVIASLIVSLYCLKWSTTFFKREGPGLWIHILRLGALLFLVIAFLQIFGKEDAAQYLFNVAVRSLVILMAFRLLAHLINGGLEWAMRNFLGPFLSLTEEEIVSALRHASFIVNTMVGFFVFCIILFNARIYGNLQDAAWGILNLGWDAGPVRITIGALASAAVIVYSAFLLSKLLQKLFIERELARRQVERGVRLSIAGLTHYVLVFIGLLIGLFALGFDLTKVTIVLSALGVGIGFGLQNIVNNFVSGIVLLMEQPVRVGDYIEVDGSWAEIKNIGLRATTVRTFDYADIIVPNADLMTNRVINWTLSTRVVRVTVPVGVAYGSDIELVMEKLLACARENPQVATIPEPQVLFLRFGDSALEFELRAWVWDADEKLRVTSDLHSHICRRFREAKIEIAFPQMDLHVRDINDSISLKKPESIQE